MADNTAVNGRIPAEGGLAATEFLRIELREAGPVFVCRCGHTLGDARRSFKEYTVMEEGPVRDAGPRVNPYNVGGRFVFRQFYCPGCYTRLETEVALKDEPILWDIQVAVPGEEAAP